MLIAYAHVKYVRVKHVLNHLHKLAYSILAPDRHYIVVKLKIKYSWIAECNHLSFPSWAHKTPLNHINCNNLSVIFL